MARRSRSSVRSLDKGFSLIELVVVIAILGILIAIALPNFLNVQKDAKINATLNLLTAVVKECKIVEIRGNEDPKIDDTGTGRSRKNQNTYGNAYGGYNFTWDTSISSNSPIVGDRHSCYQIAAKSDTFLPPNPPDGKLPHFMISYNSSTGEIERNCKVDNAATTYNNGKCDPTAPAGKQW